jgi:hypothetical protein
MPAILMEPIVGDNRSPDPSRGVADARVVDRGVAEGEQSGGVESPQLVALRAPPLAGGVVALVGEPDGEAFVAVTSTSRATAPCSAGKAMADATATFTLVAR